MKRTISLLFLVAFAGCLTAYPQKKEAPERQGWYSEEFGSLYGDVESVNITYYTLVDKFGEIVKEKVDRKCIYRFNSKGDVVECCSYNSDGSLNEEQLSKYDSQGNEIEYAKYNRYGTPEWKNFYKYDSQGNKIEHAHYNGDGSLHSKYLYKYDSQGNTIEEAWYKGDGSLEEKAFCKYNAHGKISEKNYYNRYDSLIYQTVYEYDSHGNLTFEAGYDNSGFDGERRLRHQHSFEYDSHGNVIGWEEMCSSLSTSHYLQHRYTYDAQGHMIEETLEYEKELVYNKTLYEYDSKGNVIKIAEYKNDIDPLRLKYDVSYDYKKCTLSKTTVIKYDAQGNWIEKIEYKSDIMIPVEMEERTIIYRK